MHNKKDAARRNQDLSHVSPPTSPVVEHKGPSPEKQDAAKGKHHYRVQLHRTTATPEKKNLILEGVRLQQYQELKNKQFLPQLRLQNRLGIAFSSEAQEATAKAVEESGNKKMKLLQQKNLRFDQYLSPQNKRPLN